MQESVERFDDRVRALGGDLMVDVPPVGHQGQPDEPRFELPLRRDGESAEAFTARLDVATNGLVAPPDDWCGNYLTPPTEVGALGSYAGSLAAATWRPS